MQVDLRPIRNLEKLIGEAKAGTEAGVSVPRLGGTWQLEQVQLQDKANNMTTVRAGQSEIVSAVVPAMSRSGWNSVTSRAAILDVRASDRTIVAICHG